MACAGFKPLGPSKIPMDTSKAMSILGFPSSQGFENTEMSEVQEAFMHKLQRFEICHKKAGNPRHFNSKRDELRRVNEAYQYLIRKRRKLTGRAMTDNWQLVGGKSNKAMDIITSLKGLSGPTATMSNPLLGGMSKKKDDGGAAKRQQEFDSEAAKALAEELVISAGLELPIYGILNHVHVAKSKDNSSTLPTSRKTSRHKNGDNLISIIQEEKIRRPSAFVINSHPGSYSSISLPSSYTSSISPPLSNSHSHTGLPKSDKKSKSGKHSNNRLRGSHSIDRNKKPMNGSKIPNKRHSSSNLREERPLDVVSSTSDLHSKCFDQDLLEAKALEDEGIQMVRKALSSLNLGS